MRQLGRGIVTKRQVEALPAWGIQARVNFFIPSFLFLELLVFPKSRVLDTC